MEHDPRLFAAIDLGAGSGRVLLAAFDPDGFLLREVRRFHYPPRMVDGHLRWDAAAILTDITAGLRDAAAVAHELGRPVHSLGVDCWGVDYGLLDVSGTLLEDPVCYRDARTSGVMDAVFAQIPRDDLFGRTGIQMMPFNTLFQLYAHSREGLPRHAARLLLMPDLIGERLSGRAVTEFSIGTTTQMFAAATGSWDVDLLRRLDLPADLLGEIVPPGTPLGSLTPAIADETGLRGTLVVAPAAHDTASAVAGAPLAPGWGYISSGTWSLVGVERRGMLVNAHVARQNFTNEGGVYGTTRFLSNVMGLWILESCRREWRERGTPVDYDALLGAAAAVEVETGLIFPDDTRFLNPPCMLEAIADQMRETGQPVHDAPATVAKVVLDSLAYRYASVFRRAEMLTGERVSGVQIVGGGSRNAYLNQATATATGRPVLAGPVEATATGNAVVQAITAGRFVSLADARTYVGRHVQPDAYQPKPTATSERAARRYAELEARYTEAASQ